MAYVKPAQACSYPRQATFLVEVCSECIPLSGPGTSPCLFHEPSDSPISIQTTELNAIGIGNLYNKQINKSNDSLAAAVNKCQ